MSQDSDRTCFICGHDTSAVIQEHHIAPRRYGGSDADENLVDLCPNCHDSVERIYNDAFFERLGVQKTTDESDSDIHVCMWEDCTSTDTQPLQNDDLTVWVCDAHKQCQWWKNVYKTIGGHTKTCDRTRVTPVESEDGRFTLLCSDHRICEQTGCANSDVCLYKEDDSFGQTRSRYLCEIHAREEGFDISA